MKAVIRNREINREKNGVYIVFEAGPTHSGLDSAKKLARMAKHTGANAIKFQMLSADRLLRDKKIMMSYDYLEKNDNGSERFINFSEPLYHILKRRELKREEWVALKKYCNHLDLPVICTVSYEDEMDFLVNELNIEGIKIASADITYLSFIEYCAKKCAEQNLNLQMDTGNADIWEIEKAVITVEKAGCKNIIIHLCPTGYPAHLESINLRMINTLKSLFPEYPVAFSDHSPGWDMDIAAVALGADMIEKTITLDRTIRSCEHSFSLEEADAGRFVQSIRNLETALGSTRRVIPQEERRKRKMIRRSPYASVDLRKGDEIKISDFEFKRPEAGIDGEEFIYHLGKVLIKSIKTGEALTNEHI